MDEYMQGALNHDDSRIGAHAGGVEPRRLAHRGGVGDVCGAAHRLDGVDDAVGDGGGGAAIQGRENSE